MLVWKYAENPRYGNFENVTITGDLSIGMDTLEALIGW